MLTRTCARQTFAITRWPRSPSLRTFFFNIDTRMLRYIYFLRLNPTGTRNDRYDNLSFAKKKDNVKAENNC